MFVRMWMTRDPITVDEKTPVMEAQKTLRDKNILRLPVMRGDKLVGIVTHSDLQEASPSNATTLSIYELHYLLAKLTVGKVMTKDPITVSPDTTLEEIALIMHDKKIGGLPVLEGGKLVGIITGADVLEAFIDVMGLREKGVRLSFELEHKPGALAEITKIIKKHNTNILSLATTHADREDRRRVVIRLKTDDAGPIVEELSQMGIQVEG